MRLVAGLYHACGGGKGKAAARSAAHDTYDAQQAKYEREARDRAQRKAEERAAKDARVEAERARLAQAKADKEKAKMKAKGVKRPPFNFEAEKPKIMAAVGTGTQSAQALINALQHVNRDKESVTTNERVQACLAKAKADRKIVVRYIQLVENDPSGDFIGTLLATNEQVLTALQLYDRMSKPIELDSDDEHIQQAKEDAYRQGLNVPQGPGDAASIRSKLSAFDLQDREVDKLQERQRRRVQRVNSSRVHPDLQDLAFGAQPSASTSRAAGEEDYNHGSLSEYSDSDYLSSDGEIPPASKGAPPTSASSSAGLALPGVGAKGYAAYVSDGAGQRGLLEEGEDEEDDPFGDGHAAETPALGSEERRFDWKEI